MTNKSTPSVLVVILNWNGIEDTKRCFESIQQQTFPSIDTIIVDNHSTRDNSVDQLQNDPLFKDASLALNDKNLGFAGGVNTGIRFGLDHNYDYVCLINNDAVADKNWVKHLVEASQAKASAITVGLMLNENGTRIDSAGEYFSIWGVSFPWLRDEPASTKTPSQYVFGATGGGVLYKASLFESIGLFDEKFFMYFEDADINYRAQLRGFTAYFENRAILHHRGGASSKKVSGLTTYHTFKNLPMLFWKNTPTKLLFRVGIRFHLLYLLILGNAVISGSGWPAFKGALTGIWLFLSHALWARFTIQSQKTVAARDIWKILYKDLPPNQTGMRKFRSFFVKAN